MWFREPQEGMHELWWVLMIWAAFAASRELIWGLEAFWIKRGQGSEVLLGGLLPGSTYLDRTQWRCNGGTRSCCNINKSLLISDSTFPLHQCQNIELWSEGWFNLYILYFSILCYHNCMSLHRSRPTLLFNPHNRLTYRATELYQVYQLDLLWLLNNRI